jgi:hypothetical protein
MHSATLFNDQRLMSLLHVRTAADKELCNLVAACQLHVHFRFYIKLITDSCSLFAQQVWETKLSCAFMSEFFLLTP